MPYVNIGARAAFLAAKQIERVASMLRGKGFGSFSIDQEVKAAIKALGRNPSTVIDVGGNVGEYTACMQRFAPESKVTVFEPSPTNLAILRKRFAENIAVTIAPLAVSDSPGTVMLYADRPGSGVASLIKRNLDHIGADFDYVEQVTAVTLDSYWKEKLNCCAVDILKLDIEGHELDALKGAMDVLGHTDVVQFEFGGCNIDSRTFFRDYFYFFKSSGFDLYRITPIGMMPVKNYTEESESFITANYLAIRSKQN